MDILIEKLKEHGLVTQDAIARATDRQWKEGGHLLRHLVELGAFTEEDLITFYQKVLGLHTLQLKEVEIDPEAVWHVPYRIAQKYYLIPIKRARKSLVVAMANPLNPRARKELERVTDLEIVALGAKLSEIQEAIAQYYGQKDVPLEWGAFFLRPRRDQTLRKLEQGGFLTSAALQQIERWLEVAPAGLALVGGPEDVRSSLLHAIANHLAEEKPQQGILLTQGPAFRDLLLEAFEVGFFPQLRQYFEGHEVFFIDGVESLQGAPRFEELMEWFWAKGGSILLTSTQVPSSLEFSRRFLGVLEKFEVLTLQPSEVEIPTHVRVTPKAQKGEESLAAEESYPLTSTTLEFLAEQAREKGIRFHHTTSSASGAYPPWLFHGLLDLTKRILSAAEPGDEIHLRTIETPKGWVVEFETKGLLLMMGEEAVRESFRGQEVQMQKLLKQGGSVTLRIQIEGKEPRDV